MSAPPDVSVIVHPRRVSIARRAAMASTVALALALMGQVATAGAAVFVDPTWWLVHAAMAHWFDWLTVAIVVLAFAGRMSRRFKVLSVTLVLLMLVQYVTAGLRDSATLGAGAALHPLTGFVLFWAATELMREVWAGRSRWGLLDRLPSAIHKK